MSARLSLNPWPHGHIAAVAIRDDDVSYFTSPDNIEQIYSRAWKQGFSVSLGLIPNVKAIDDFFVPPNFRGKMSNHKLNNNEALIDYLKEKLATNKIAISQHGYTHETIDGVPEFSIKDPVEIKTRIEAGLRLLEDAFHRKISAFIPPWNSVSKKARELLNEYGLTICLGKKKKYPWKSSYIFRPATQAKWKAFTNSRVVALKENAKTPRTIEMYSSVDPWSNKHQALVFSPKLISEAHKDFESVVKAGGFFCFLNHHWGYYKDWQDDVDEELLGSFYSLLNFVNNYDIWKATLSDVIEWTRKLEKISFNITGNYLRFISPSPLEGLTIRAEGCSIAPGGGANANLKREGNTACLIFEQLTAGKEETVFIDN